MPNLSCVLPQRQHTAEPRRSLQTGGFCERNDGLKRDQINFLPELRRSVLPSSSLPRGGIGSPGQAGRTKSQEMAASALRCRSPGAGSRPGKLPFPKQKKRILRTAGGRGFKEKKKRGVWCCFFFFFFVGEGFALPPHRCPAGKRQGGREGRRGQVSAVGGQLGSLSSFWPTKAQFSAGLGQCHS